MPAHAVSLYEKHFRVAEQKAKDLGTTPDEYIHRLIDAEDALSDLSFDRLLAPVRKGFEHLDDAQLDEILSKARASSIDSNGK